MKKNYFLGAAAAFGLLAFSSCSNDDDPVLGQGEVANGEQVIVLDMQDTDVLSTKSRPLYSTSNKGAEEVTDVKLLFFYVQQDGTQKLIHEVDIPNWDQISKEYNYGQKYSIRLKGEDRLKIEGKDATKKEGFITIVAVGQNEKAAAPAPFKWNTTAPVSLPGWTIDGQVADEANKIWTSAAEPGKGFAALFTNPVGKDSHAQVSEIFSGTSEKTPVKLDGGFEATVLLKRQVAGVLGYFNNIPATVKNANGVDMAIKYVRLVASQRNTQLDLTTQLGLQTDDATEIENEDSERVVNGFSTDAATKDAKYNGTQDADDAYTVYTIDLTKWFTGWENDAWSDASKTEDGLLKPEKWVNALDVANKMPVVAQGAVLAGEFVIPFDGINASNTFELQLLTKDLIVAKAWDVKLDPNSQDDKYGDGELVYNIYRNHLYQVGQRGDGDTPEKPGTDPDKPQPLNKDQDLVIKINDNWEFIHDMEIE